MLTAGQAFENTSTSVAAAQMRNALTGLAETVEDPDQKKVRYIYIPIKPCVDFGPNRILG